MISTGTKILCEVREFILNCRSKFRRNYGSGKGKAVGIGTVVVVHAMLAKRRQIQQVLGHKSFLCCCLNVRSLFLPFPRSSLGAVLNLHSQKAHVHAQHMDLSGI